MRNNYFKFVVKLTEFIESECLKIYLFNNFANFGDGKYSSAHSHIHIMKPFMVRSTFNNMPDSKKSRNIHIRPSMYIKVK